MTARCALYMGTCAENFRESLSRPTVTCPEIFNGLLFRAILWMCVQNLKFLALPVPEIIGGIQKIGQSLDTPTPTCLQIFYGFLLGLSLRMFRPNLKVTALNVPEIIECTA